MKDHSSKIHPGLERVPGKQNWVDYAGGLPNYIERIAKHIHADSGYTISHAIASAVNRVKKLIATGSPETKAKAAKALAEWEAKKVRSKIKLTDAELIAEVVINMAETPEKKAGTKSAGVGSKETLLKAIAAYKAKKASMTPEQRAKTEARLKSSQQRLGMKVGLSEEKAPSAELAKKVEIFEKNRWRLDLSEQESITKHLEALAKDSGVTISLSESVQTPVGSTIARNTRFNPAKHNRGFGGRWAPKSSVKTNTAALDGAVNGLAVGESIDMPGGKGKIKRVKNGFQVVKGDGSFNKVFKNASDAISVATTIAAGRIGQAVKK